MTHGDHANKPLQGPFTLLTTRSASTDPQRAMRCPMLPPTPPPPAPIPNMLTCFLPSDNCCRPHAPKECQRQMEPPELLMTACSRHCKNGHCTPTGKCCCSPGWEGPLCRDGECLSVDSHALLSKLYHTDAGQGSYCSCGMSNEKQKFYFFFALTF